MLRLLVAAIALAVPTASALAQPLGTYRWQLQPYCNVLSLRVSHQAGIYRLDGTDDLCGATQPASAVGIAFLNADQTVGFGLTSVLPGGIPVHIEANISLSSVNGSWRDSAGNSGAFVFTPGSGTGGSARPVPSGGIAAGSVTSAQLAAGSVTSAHIADAAVGATQLAPSVVAGYNIINESVTTVDILDSSLTGDDLAPNSVSGAHVMDGSLELADIGDAPRVRWIESPDVQLTQNIHTIVAQVTLPIPAAGRVIVNASGAFSFQNNALIEGAICSLTTGVEAQLPFSAFAQESIADMYRTIPFGGTRTFVVAPGSATFRLVCFTSNAQIWLYSPVLTALFIAGT